MNDGHTFFHSSTHFVSLSNFHVGTDINTMANEILHLNKLGRDSSVCVATPYALEGPGTDPGVGKISRTLSRPALGPTQPPIQIEYRVFLGGKAAGAWRSPPTPI
jgi:hypothetical protein